VPVDLSPLPAAGLVLEGRLLSGDEDTEHARVVVDRSGSVVGAGPSSEVATPPDASVVAVDGGAVLPGLVDAHVHLALGSPGAMLAGGVLAVRDLGAPLADAAAWRDLGADAAPLVAVAGPLHTAPGGYPSRGWGADGFAAFVDGPAAAHASVGSLAGTVDVIKLALEPAGGPVPDLATAAAVVEAAHGHGLAVTAHALGAHMVRRALDAGVDELCHVPLEPLGRELVDRLAAARVGVVSSLRTHLHAGGDVLGNARDLVAAGVRIVYGTDLGNAGTEPGADPVELRLLAEAGLGPDGALAAATHRAAEVPGLRGRVSGRVQVGEPARLLLVRGDPRAEPAVLREPYVVVVGARWHLAARRLPGWES
jgi:imidazolonepropionase-like amidohydrolase